MATYGQTIIWIKDWHIVSIRVEGCDSPMEALEKALKMAKDSGWKPPRWWEFWRWAEPDYVAMYETTRYLPR